MKKQWKNAAHVYQIYKNRKWIWPMIGDAIRGRYQFSLFTLLSIILFLGYMIFPFDFLPDFIPVIGWVDDGVFLVLLLRQLKKETVRYQEYKTKDKPVIIIK
jgi:uncharacterized membrane protein YkvA (DUF1232 family)